MMLVANDYFQKKLAQDCEECKPPPKQKVEAIITNIASYFFNHAFNQQQTLLRRKIIFHVKEFRMEL